MNGVKRLASRGVIRPQAGLVIVPRPVAVSQHIRTHSALAEPALNQSTFEPRQFPAYVLNCPETRLSTLPNGLRVASQTNFGDTATVGVWIDAGSRYESEQNNGAAHFFEHMVFKGTKRRPQMQLEVEIENMGAHLNAYTSREQTVYYAKAFRQNVGHAVDVLSDILQNSLLDEQAINRERDTILREMEEVNKAHDEVVLDHLHEVAFQGTGLGRTILGPEENIQSLQRKDLTDYLTTHYTAPRMVVAGAGALEHEDLVQLADKHFGHLPTRPPPGSITDPDPARFTGSEKRVFKQEEGNKAYVGLAFEGASWNSEFHYHLMIIQMLLGGWERAAGLGGNVPSPLAREIAQGDLCHSYTTFNTCYKDTGLFGLYTIAQPETLPQLMSVLLRNIMRMCHSVSEEEVSRAKMQLKTNMLTQMDTFSAVCEDVGRQMLIYGRRMSPAEVFARINAIDAQSVMLCANMFLNDEDFALAAVGPVQTLPVYEQLRSMNIHHIQPGHQTFNAAQP